MMLVAASIGFFIFMLAAAGGAGYWFLLRQPSAAAALSGRVQEAETLDDPLQERPNVPAWIELLAEIGESTPLEKNDRTEVRRDLSAAGIREEWGEAVFYGAKALGLILLPAVCFIAVYLLRGELLPAVAPALLLGYIGVNAPKRFLKRRIRSRRQKLNRSLPDFLDLLVIAVESGLSLEHAVADTARDLRRAHPELAAELTMFRLEIQAGTSRPEALRNLGKRAGEPELKKLSSLLIQADRFGTSISKVLRTQARYMRIKRRQKAEEMAHKVGVKMIFPIFFLIMPSVFLVTAGPAVLMLMTNLADMAGGR